MIELVAKKDGVVLGRPISLLEWQAVGDLLYDMSCDTTSLSNTREGDLVKKSVAESWGYALRDELRRLRIFEMKLMDSRTPTGFRTQFVVTKPGEDTSELAPLSHESATFLLELAMFFMKSKGFYQY